MNENATRTGTLASIIAENTSRINAYVTSQQMAPWNFEREIPLNLPVELEEARIKVVNASLELNELMTGARALTSLDGFNSIGKIPVWHFIYHFGIAQKVPLDGDISYQDLSQEIGVNVSIVRQILRAGISHRLFREIQPGHISHSGITRVLRDDKSVEDWIGFLFEDALPGYLRIVEALSKHPEGDDPSKSAFMLAHNSQEKSIYLHMDKTPNKSRRFAGTMASFQSGAAYSLHHLTQNFPWNSLNAATIVDVGGSTGEVAFGIAEVAPELSIIVQDLPQTIMASQLRPDVNVSFMVHDFFEQQPVKNADVYLFRWIFHNWPDALAANILQALIPALKPGAKILIMDEVIPPNGTLPITSERNQRLMDMGMLSLFSSKLRAIDDWKDLIRLADARFCFKSVTEPKGSNLALIEITWQPRVPFLSS